jgi:conjugative relaxase-like TrwC/TraI family protein
MVSITNVSAGQASHYYSKDNYYTKQVGEWQGKGAEKLGLQGEIKKEDFNSLISGKLPNGAEIANGGDKHEHRAGTDITFSAPKSVSIAAEVLGDDRVREAHEKAVEKTLSYIEQHYAQARQTQDGITTRIDTGNLVIAKFEHSTSRELDPQLHTHAVVLNMTQREDGQWRALSNEEIFSNKMLIGQHYRNELAANLKELGYSIQSNEKGLFEIQGIPKELIDHYSQRSEQIQQKVQELKDIGQYHGANEQKLREIATLGSRVAKKDVNMNDVKQSWQERLQQQGYTKEQLQSEIQKASEQAKTANYEQIRMNEYDAVRQAAAIHTEQESTFSREDILKTAGKLSVGEHRMSDLEKAFDELNNDKEIKQLDKNVYTTAEMQWIERDIVEKVKTGHDSMQAISTKEQAEQGISMFEKEKGFSLTDGQKEAVNHILTSQDRYIGIQGDAGTGKTTMLAAVRGQAEKQGYEVRGLGFTGKAASEVEAQAGIKSQTIDSFLARNDTSGNKQLWVVDEASMLGSRKMHEIMEKTEISNAKVVMIGDTKQLQSIEAGKTFVKLQETGELRTVRMSEVQRQTDESYKAVVKDMSEKRIDSAFEKLETKGRISEIADRKERLEALKNDYLVKGHKDTIIVTARNQDRNELNSSIRESLKEQGKIDQQEYSFTVRESKNLSPTEKHFAQSYSQGDRIIANKAGLIGRAGTEAKVTEVDQQQHAITVQTKDGQQHNIDLKSQGQHLAVYSEKEQSFSQGDKVVFLKNDKGLGVKNGQIGTIRSIDDKGNAKVTMENGKEKSINLKTQYNYIDHGYAVTDYKSQGQTAKHVLYHADTSKKVNYNQAYVAATRGKQDLRIYTNDKTALRDRMKHEQVKTSTLDYKQEQGQQQTKQQQQPMQHRGRGIEM